MRRNQRAGLDRAWQLMCFESAWEGDLLDAVGLLHSAAVVLSAMKRCRKATVNVLFLFRDTHKTWSPPAVAMSAWRLQRTNAVNGPATLLRPPAASCRLDTACRGGDVLWY